MSSLSFRNSDGDLVDVPSVPATRFKNEFGAIFEQAALGGAVAITKHNTPKAVLLSYAEFQALTRSSSPVLDELDDEFDALLARMQTAAGQGWHGGGVRRLPRASSAARRSRRPDRSDAAPRAE